MSSRKPSLLSKSGMYSLPSLNGSLKSLKIDLQRQKHKLYVLLDLIYGFYEDSGSFFVILHLMVTKRCFGLW